ncbi:hypothetical protein [Natronolimnohabitans innermongolicus]|uniref:Uncharacterized protein n=1 Tax=Natronolimnohabitans innermongolicus JCM 12255 TaxID=1227499 RepID=L9XE14_9EURY|nr:hypothetical protein [Natronolimnohabitans innermongolicus]ELY59959.1 hypothetical protein C493_04483 [Natronolimnohabitans innermongolicus JCM 12255]
MASGATLPGTAIEWYMFGALLVVVNIVVLVVTGHTVFQAVAMGLFYGLGLAMVLLFLAVGVTALREKNASD